MSTTDYQRLYNDYWSRADRWGSSSFADAGELADRILMTCGNGPVLDVGCGMGVLVRTLLGLGIDAQGVDISDVAMQALDARIPGRFRTGSVLALPYEDNAFDTVVTTDVLEHLAEEDIPAALAELRRVARDAAFMVIATTVDRDEQWHLTVRDRNWWETRFLEAGFRKHPLMTSLMPFDALETESAQIAVAFQAIPDAGAASYPLERLHEGQMLHMDMLRATGRRSEAHLARYDLARPFVRPNDVVLDAGCGLGYGSAMVAAGTTARRVIGVDASDFAVAYAEAHYRTPAGVTEFRQGSVTDLSFLADASVDFMIAMEILEHLEEPRAFLTEAYRVLKPSGRILLSVPNDWSDETGEDPNPYHHHVYTFDRFEAQLTERFLLERVYAQTAGGGVKLPNAPRKLRPTRPADAAHEPAEWWIALAMKDPVPAAEVDYEETTFCDHSDLPGYHVTAFKRDYDNPWLVRSMVAIGMRASEPNLLEDLARRVLDGARPGSADAGAALCVQGYRLIEDPHADRAGILDHLARIAAYHDLADDSPHGWRWRISNQYVAGRLHLALGQLDEARDAFLSCAAMDPMRFTPLLATKTVDALYRAGAIEAGRAQWPDVRQHWERALAETHRVLQGDWTNIWGRPGNPTSFGLQEVTQLLNLATRCANGLLMLERWPLRPGLAWWRTQSNLASEQRRLVSERNKAMAEADRLAQCWTEHTARIQELQTGYDRLWGELQNLADHRTNLQSRIADCESQRDAAVAEQKRLLEELARESQRLTGERDEVRAEVQRLTNCWEEQQTRIQELETSRQSLWNEVQQAAAEQSRLQQGLSEAMESQQAALTEAQRLGAIWEQNKTHVAKLEQRHAQMWEELQETTRECQRLGNSWQNANDRIHELEQVKQQLWEQIQQATRARGDELQRAFHERDDAMAEASRLAGCWEEQRQQIQTLEAQVAHQMTAIEQLTGECERLRRTPWNLARRAIGKLTKGLRR